MFKTGIVCHYVKEYSHIETRQIKKSLQGFIDKDIISPSIIKSDEYKNQIIENLPIGTIIVKDMSVNVESYVICLPMFSSHLSMPVKRGEAVWFFKNEDKIKSDVESVAPLLSVKNYWLSRKIGLKVSEDLNYSSFHRDFIINKNTEDNLYFSLPDYENSPVLDSLFDDLPDSKKLYKEAKANSNFFPAPVPRWHSKPYELTLQGSNNSLVNITNSFLNKKSNDAGAVDIVAGRHAVREYIPDTAENLNFVVFDKPINDNKKSFVKLTKDSFLYMKNLEDDLETIKNQKIYLPSEASKNEETLEGQANLLSDASRIYISERDNLDNSGGFYDTSYLSSQSILDFEGEKVLDEVKTIKVHDKEIPIKNLNFPTKNLVVNNQSTLPSILIKSNNIRIVARRKFSYLNNILQEGSIRIIKESSITKNNSHICLEKNGQVLIDGKTIMIGNFSRQASQSLQSNKETMHGGGTGLLIGYHENLSEPLVLGDTLVTMMKELLDINMTLVEEIKNISVDLINHTHAGVMSGAASTLPVLPASIGTAKSANNFIKNKIGPSTGKQNNEDINKRYKDLQDNLNRILSRFAKTT